jgi:group II intron reverse transcriptase/maturase
MSIEPFKKLFSRTNLLEALDRYKSHKEYAPLKVSIENGTFYEALKHGYVPEPMGTFMIPKHDGEMRQIAVASLSSKIVQRIIADALNQEIHFSNKSYAFRQGKGPLKAVSRTKDFLKKYRCVAKADIDDFFDTIDHNKLFIILEKIVPDKKTLGLISLFLKNGMLEKNRWINKNRGIYQGNVLSPVLSNIYLHSFDIMLEKEGIDFVRFADDMVFFAQNEKEAKRHLARASALLEILGLQFGEEKSYVSCIEKGFEFLGLRFKGDLVLMDNDRLMEKLSILSQKTKKKDLVKSVDFFNDYIDAIRRYYLKVLNKTSQLLLIEEHIDAIIVHKIVEAKESKQINKKSKFIQIISDLQGIHESTSEEKIHHARELVTRAYETITLKDPLKTAQKQMGKKKREHFQEQIKGSEIILNRYGLYVSVSRGRVVVKEFGKVVKKMPLSWVSRIVVLTKGASLSSALIYECSKRKIDIDFIAHQQPYAQITYHTTISHDLHLKQIDAKGATKGMEISRNIVRAKMKNQINLLKYHLRYREEHDREEAQKLDSLVTQMQKIYKRIDNTKNVPKLMGYEGSVSVLYWQGFGVLIGNENFKRETQDAPDAVNQALNYGYAFIYHRLSE